MSRNEPLSHLVARALGSAARRIDRHAEAVLDEETGRIHLGIAGYELVISSREEADEVEAALEGTTDLDSAIARMPVLSAMESPAPPRAGLQPGELASAVVQALIRAGDLAVSDADSSALEASVAAVLDSHRHGSCGPALLEALQRAAGVVAVLAPQAKLRRTVQACATELRNGVEPATAMGWQ